MKQTKKPLGITSIKLFIDLGVLTLFLLVSAPPLTGLAGHEWLSLIFIVPFLTHLTLNWKWIVNIFSHILNRLPGETRFNQIWDTLLFTMMTFVIFSGISVSQKALPALGIHLKIDPFWRSIHTTSANLLLLMFGVHLAIHWKWLVNNFRRYILRQPVGEKLA